MITISVTKTKVELKPNYYEYSIFPLGMALPIIFDLTVYIIFIVL